MANKSDKASALLSLIQKAPTGPSAVISDQAQAPEVPDGKAPAKRAHTTKSPNFSSTAATGSTGKRTQVFLHEGDRIIIRELLAYFAGQGRRVSESLVIKAALRAVKPGEELLKAHQQAAAQDQRFKEHSV